MPRELSTYHRRIAVAKRKAILDAATDLFLEFGYDRTSLAQVAARAGVSKATLFKQFPTKAELFEAMVLAAGGAAGEVADDGAVEASGDPEGVTGNETADLPTGDFCSGLVVLGSAYAELLRRPRMVDLVRTLIAESARFPELRKRTFDLGTLPSIRAVRRYFKAQQTAGEVRMEDPDTAATQFLGMISNVVFWPQLIHGNWSQSEAEVHEVVVEAARTIVARYTNSGLSR